MAWTHRFQMAFRLIEGVEVAAAVTGVVWANAVFEKWDRLSQANKQ